MNKKVSIIIPTYNGEKYIKETIDSCLNQTYKDIEIIVIDDCSSDSTISILKSYGNKIKLIMNKKNLGISKNVNKGCSLSSGEFILLLGHDDLLNNKHIEIMLSEFEPQTVAVYCNSMIIDGDNNQKYLSRDDDIQIKKTKEILFYLSIDNFINSCGMIHKKDCFINVGGWDEKYKFYGEWLYYTKALNFGEIKYSKKVHSFYRRHETNITNSFKNEKISKGLELYFNESRNVALQNLEKDNIKLLKRKLILIFSKLKLALSKFKKKLL